MAVVTPLEYYMDNNLTKITELAITRINMNWDSLLIFDGEEGSGKSTFAIALCHYIAFKMNKEFTVDNIFFDLDKLTDYASKTEKKVILWDESALGGLASEWQSKTQNKLVKALMVARKKQHFWIFCIPQFYELRKYLVRRSIGLIHIYSPDEIKRGFFTYFKKQQKNWLYDIIKQTKTEKHYRRYSFAGKFIDYSKKPLIDWKAYEDKKDDAILNMFKEVDTKASKTKEKLLALRFATARLTDCLSVNQKDLAKYLKVASQTVSDWYNLDSQHKNILEMGHFRQNRKRKITLLAGGKGGDEE